MLDPENRHLLTDALRPPDGYAVEIALATTYTLDLQSVLLAPLAMAAYDQRHAGGLDQPDTATPLALLESIRRHAEHTTVLCQAGGVHVPSDYPKLAAFAEGCVAEVMPPPGRTFHPKIWLLRFVDDKGSRRHRLACLSRNLTGDRSWDTVLICDETFEDGPSIDAAPVATFVTELIETTSLVRPLAPERREQLLDLCSTVRSARFGVPAPFTEGRVIPLGTPSGEPWPLPATADAWTVISPFLDAGAISRVPRTKGPRTLLSREDTFGRLGSRACLGADLRVLQPVAETDSSDYASEGQSSPAARGLHAKVFAWNVGRQGHLLVGSANCTSAAFGGNIELSVLLSGPKSSCGLTPLLGDETTGFLRIAQSHMATEAEPTPDPAYTAERHVEGWQVALAGAALRLMVTEGEQGFDLRLAHKPLDDPHDLASRTTVRPIGTRNTPWRQLTDRPSWRNIGLAGLTPYLAVSTTADVVGTNAEITRECVLICEVVGAPEDRLTRLLRDLLSREEDVLRYLALLLGDPSLDDLLDRLTADKDDDSPADTSAVRPGFDDLVLLEPLVRAAARGDNAVGRAHRLLEDLRDEHGDLPHLSSDFLELWDVVWKATT